VKGDYDKRGAFPLVGSRRYKQGRSEFDRTPSRELILEIVCVGLDDPDHGAQVMLRVGRDLARPETDIYLLGDHDWIDRPGGGAKAVADCPKMGCRGHVEYTVETLRELINTVEMITNGRAAMLRWDFRRMRLLA
jgi:hypothetical protein